MAMAAKLGQGFDLHGHVAPEIRPTWKGRPVAFYAARLRAKQRLMPLSGPLPVREGLAARIVVRVEGFSYRPGPSGQSLTEIAGLEIVRFDLDGMTPTVAEVRSA
jgi:hypothetical protein